MTDIHCKSFTRIMYFSLKRKKLISLLYLAIDHYIEANSIHFIQSAIGFTIVILVIPGISVVEISVDLKGENKTGQTGNGMTDLFLV